MARPKKLTLDFFVHSSNARSDRRIKSLRRREKNDGYATYYILLEMSCAENDMKLDLSNDITIEDVAEECGLRDVAHLYKVIESCISVGLFNAQLWRSDRIIFSDDLYASYLDRLEERKATAERKNRSVEAKSLQEKIDRVTGETKVITQETDIVTCDNSPEERDQNLEIRTERSELRDQNSHTKQESAACAIAPKKINTRISDVERFEQKWRSPIKIDCYKLSQDLGFQAFVLKKLQNMPSAKKGDWVVEMSTAVNHIKKGVTDLEARGKIETYYEEYLVLQESEKSKQAIAANSADNYIPRPHPSTWTDEQKTWTHEDWQNYLREKQPA